MAYPWHVVITKVAKLRVAGCVFGHTLSTDKNKRHSMVGCRFLCRQYPMHEVVPRVVAMAVRMVMAMCRIFCQMFLVSIVSRLVFLLMVFVDVFLSPQITQILTDFH